MSGSRLRWLKKTMNFIYLIKPYQDKIADPINKIRTPNMSIREIYSRITQTRISQPVALFVCLRYVAVQLYSWRYIVYADVENMLV